VNKEPFEFWFCQKEAIETLIYVYEVMKKRNFVDMTRDFGAGPIQGYDPSYDQYPLYAFKMATGSGKTYVMALSLVWQYRVAPVKPYPSNLFSLILYSLGDLILSPLWG